MRKEFVYKLAIVGVAAVAAVFALTSGIATESTALFTPMGAEDLEYIQFVAKYTRNFGTKEEYEFRLKTFKKNKARMNAFNLSDKTHTSTVGVNQFADMTKAEYKKMLGYIPRPVNANTAYTFLEEVSFPESLDWRAKGVVTPVKNQG
jgi:C1A family cysteine protease